MPKIDPTKLTKEIKNKYSVVSNAFRLSGGKKELTKDGKPKDLIITEVGDVKQAEFYPQVKIGRWGDDDSNNEVNLSLRLLDGEKGNTKLETENDKIKWSKGNKTARFYEIAPNEEYPDGAFEFDIELAKKPKTNIIEFSLNTKGVDFFYQPALTQQEIDEGSIRPENVVGSYAVYASEQKTNWKDGKEYKVGKVGHIFRPKIYDASGAECWGKLIVDKEAGKLSVEIPQEFLDNAVYPIRHAAGLTFGYTTLGSSITTGITYYSGSTHVSRRCGSFFASPGTSTITEIHFAVQNSAAVSANTMVFVNQKDSGGSGTHAELGRSGDVSISYPTTKDWRSISSLSINVDSGIDLILNFTALSTNNPSGGGKLVASDTYGSVKYYQITAASSSSAATAYSNAKASPLVGNLGIGNTILSIYATYTAGGGGSARVPRHGFIHFNVPAVA